MKNNPARLMLLARQSELTSHLRKCAQAVQAARAQLERSTAAFQQTQGALQENKTMLAELDKAGPADTASAPSPQGA